MAGNRASFNFESSVVLETAVEAMMLRREPDLYRRLALVELSTEHGMTGEVTDCLIQGRVLFWQLRDDKCFWHMGKKPTTVEVIITCHLHELGRLHTYNIREKVAIHAPAGTFYFKAGPNQPLMVC